MKKEIFVIGEKKYIGFRIKSRDGKEDFIIRNCEYELYKNRFVESRGEGEIEGHIIYALVEPQTISDDYILVISYNVANQILKEMVPIEVIGP